VQGAGETPTVVSSAPRRIVPVGAGPRRILQALGLESRTTRVNDSLVGLPLVGEIRRARPNLIVASSDTDPLDLARARAATHAAVYVEPSSAVDEVVGAIGDIGLLTGRPLEARRLTAAIESRRRKVGGELAGVPFVRVFVDTGGFSTVPARSLLGDLVHEAHGRSVGGASPEQGPFPLKRLRALDPDVYLATTDSAVTLRELRAERATRRLRAVRAGRFGIVPPPEVLAGPEIAAALAQIARILHPDAVR
jgi:ABC-type Fe3+-hydroxamate transport system substrate-binding protein